MEVDMHNSFAAIMQRLEILDQKITELTEEVQDFLGDVEEAAEELEAEESEEVEEEPQTKEPLRRAKREPRKKNVVEDDDGYELPAFEEEEKKAERGITIKSRKDNVR